VRIAPLAMGVELALIATAARGGWTGQKFTGYRWLFENREYLRSRRRSIQAARVRSDSDLAPILSARMDVPAEFGMTPPKLADAALAHAWKTASKPRRTRQRYESASDQRERLGKGLAPHADRR